MVDMPVNRAGGNPDRRPKTIGPSPGCRCHWATRCRIGIPLDRCRRRRQCGHSIAAQLSRRRDGYCLDPTNPLRLTDVAIRYDGIRDYRPATVADFLPPVLRKLTHLHSGHASRSRIRRGGSTGDRRGRPLRQAVPRCRAAAARRRADRTRPSRRHRWNARSSSARRPEAGGRICEAPTAFPRCSISGPPNELVNQARLLSSDVARLAVSSNAVVGPLKYDATTACRRHDHPRPRSTGVNATALNPQVVDPAGPNSAGPLGAQASGFICAVPTRRCRPAWAGSVVASVNGETIDQWPTDDTGAIDRWVAVPNRLLQRYTNLGVAINISGNTGRCGEFQPITLTIDGDSPVQSEPPTLR